MFHVSCKNDSGLDIWPPIDHFFAFWVRFLCQHDIEMVMGSNENSEENGTKFSHLLSSITLKILVLHNEQERFIIHEVNWEKKIEEWRENGALSWL